MARRSLSVVTVGLSLTAGGLLATGATSGLFRGRFANNGDEFERWIRVGLVVAAAAVGLLLFQWLKYRLAEPARRKVPPPQPDPRLLRKLRDDAAKALDEHHLRLDDVLTFVALVIDPPRHRQRVAETVGLEERVITQHVSVEFALPPVATPDVPRYVPVLSPMKGQLVDNFRLADASGRSLSDLSFVETTRLAAAGLILLLQNAAVGVIAAPEPDDGGDQLLPPDQITAEPVPEKTITELLEKLDPRLGDAYLFLLQEITWRGRVDPATAAENIASSLDLVGTLISADGRRQLQLYVLALSVAYPIVAVAPKEIVAGNRVLLRYERALVPAALSKRRRGLMRVLLGLNRGMLRVMLGIKPYQIALPLQLASTAASYHMRLNGPDNKYVLGQHFLCHGCGLDVARDWVPTADPQGEFGCFHTTTTDSESPRVRDPDRHFRLRPRSGQSFVHLYLRGFGSSTKPYFRDLYLLAQFKEVPPGSRAAAAVTAAACTALVGLMGHLVSANTQPASVPALLLAIPAAAASWFGFAGDAQTLVGSSLLARLSQLVTAAVCFVAIGVYFTSHHGHLPGGIAIVGISEPVWVGLFAVSAINFLYVSYRFALKLQRYHSLLRKREQVDLEDPLW
ncbi:hypothetical protein [Asanoa siamensis]|uniref:Uncharacterized protein n=1 Tax=Asanoa siamensis TaxID=926357 RepID=A0ABQ4CP82_9ACTN|nr:hypothetical protein [Asanoa siamensis]GIF73108.1 hypothetical protein Asi02nite_26260 [Asanoa siamensis]